MAPFFSGTPSEITRTQRFDPQRQQAFNQVLQQALAGLQQTPASFEPIAQREMERFQTETVPSIAERFTSLGAQRSSGFQEALAKSGQQLGTQLGALGSQHNLASRGQLMQLLGMGLTPQEEINYQEERPSGLAMLGGQIGGGLGMGIPLAMANLGSGGGGNILQLLMRLLGRGQQQQGSQASDLNIPRYKI